MTALRTLLFLAAPTVALVVSLSPVAPDVLAQEPGKKAGAKAGCCKECSCAECCGEVQKGKGKGPGFQGGGKADHQADMTVFHYLLDHRKEIHRKVTDLPDGVETLTESANKQVAAKIQEHVEAMHRRIKEWRPIHMRDPLFREIFRHTDKIAMKVEKTAKGVRVRETSRDPHVARLIQAHAKVVSGFIANGYDEVRKNHPIPDRPGK